MLGRPDFVRVLDRALDIAEGPAMPLVSPQGPSSGISIED